MLPYPTVLWVTSEKYRASNHSGVVEEEDCDGVEVVAREFK